MAGTAPHIPGCRDLSLIGERVARSLFTAHSDTVGGTVTITVFPPLSEGRTRAGFDAAAATAQRLGAHPSVLTIHEWGHADDHRPWIVTDPQPAESVDTLLTLDGPLDVERSLQVGILLAGALETAHLAGIVHGDLQPDRIVFGSHGEPLLVETGLAGFAVFPGLGALNNPVRYHSPPEVLERTEVSPATDVYSLATTVYALLAGRAPHQKPAEVTDSNASLLLRILQMSVPPINRPDLPPGLEDALRGPLSATPGKRPQQVIEVAWLLQDVQRRAGLAVTEPVVFDLDDLTPAGSRGTATVRSAAPLAAPDAEPPPPPMPRFPAPEVEPPPLAARDWTDDAPPAAADWTADTPQPDASPWSALAGDQSDDGALWGPIGDAVPPFPAMGGVPAAEPRPEAPAGPAPTDPADGRPALWDPASNADSPPDTLWPSQWPTENAPAGDDLPAWAVGPSHEGQNGGAPVSEASPHANGDAAPSGDADDPPAAAPAPEPFAGGAPPPSFTPADRPPELDELPAWYTAPLPNQRNGANGIDRPAGHPPDSGAIAFPGAPNGATTDEPRRPLARRTPRPPAARPPTVVDGATGDRGDAPWSPAQPPAPTPASWPHAPSPLPGAGDELRSLFGEVVGDPAEAPPPPVPSPPAVGRDVHPFGPPEQRPPIDRDDPDRHLGPAPYPPPTASRPSNGSVAPSSPLPGRHETPGASPFPDGPTRLPRAGAADVPTQPRAARPGPRQVAGGPEPGPAEASAAKESAGPPALPVVILVVVVILLALGAVWLVLTDDDAGAPATDEDRTPAAEASAE
jgi:hypothetical protein